MTNIKCLAATLLAFNLLILATSARAGACCNHIMHCCPNEGFYNNACCPTYKPPSVAPPSSEPPSAAPPSSDVAQPPMPKPEERSDRDQAIPKKESDFMEKREKAQAFGQEALKQLIDDANRGPSVRAATKEEREAGQNPPPESLADEMYRKRKEIAWHFAGLALDGLFEGASTLGDLYELSKDLPTPPPGQIIYGGKVPFKVPPTPGKRDDGH